MTSNFKIQMDDQVFSIVFPSPPEREFAKYRSVIPLHDNELFEKPESVVGLKVHWQFRSGLFQKVAGVMEVKVLLQAARAHDVTSLDGLKQQLHADFKRELTRIGYSGEAVQFENLIINGRSWLRYQVPVLRVIEYSTSLSDKRFLTVRFAFIDNTGDKSHAWYQEANELSRKLTESMRVQ